MPERAYRTWGERTGELILLAIDETGWLSLVGLTNRGFLGGADRGRPRVDFADLETFSDGSRHHFGIFYGRDASWP